MLTFNMRSQLELGFLKGGNRWDEVFQITRLITHSAAIN